MRGFHGANSRLCQSLNWLAEARDLNKLAGLADGCVALQEKGSMAVRLGADLCKLATSRQCPVYEVRSGAFLFYFVGTIAEVRERLGRLAPVRPPTALRPVQSGIPSNGPLGSVGRAAAIRAAVEAEQGYDDDYDPRG